LGTHRFFALPFEDVSPGPPEPINIEWQNSQENDLEQIVKIK
jgi:hypothetical protein